MEKTEGVRTGQESLPYPIDILPRPPISSSCPVRETEDAYNPKGRTQTMASTAATRKTPVVTSPTSGPTLVSTPDETQETTTKRRGRQKGQVVRSPLHFNVKQLDALAVIWNASGANLETVMEALPDHPAFEGVNLEGRKDSVRQKIYDMRKAGVNLAKSPKNRSPRLSPDFVRQLNMKLQSEDEAEE